MAGRNDFGVLRSDFAADPRAHQLAAILVERCGVPEPYAISTASGIIPQLGLWAMRETDDGVLPGDGVSSVRAATGMPISTCKEVIAALRDSELLRAVRRGLYLVGFRECYGPILQTRRRNRRNAKAKRALETTRDPERVSDTSATHNRHVTAQDGNSVGLPAVPAVPCRAVPERSEPTPPCERASDGGLSPSAPDDEPQGEVEDLRGEPTPNELIACRVILDKLVEQRGRDGPLGDRGKLRDGVLAAERIREYLDLYQHRDPFRLAILGVLKIRRETARTA